MSNYKVPGVYVEETNSFPPSVVAVATAVPAFIGYTKSNYGTAADPVVKKIESMKDYEDSFGSGKAVSFTVVSGVVTFTAPAHRMYYGLQHYFINGGGPCYIVSVGQDSATVSKTDLQAGLDALDTYDEPTLLVFPDELGIADRADVYKSALDKCAQLQDRFLISDLSSAEISDFKTNIGTADLDYGAAYIPALKTSLTYVIDEVNSTVDGTSMASLLSGTNANTAAYHEAKTKINAIPVVLGASSALAGVYASVDSSRGVWKAPANVSLNAVIEPVEAFTESQLGDLNIDASTGKSINAIRKFTGKGTLVWGARTLDGNSNDWRYISVRRLFIMVEESLRKATQRYVFEPNNAGTWTEVKAMTSNFLTNLWRQGALMGATPEEAFFVNVGLGSTMTQQNVLDGELIIEVGMAAVRPAEFIILKFSHKMMDA